MSKVGLYLGTFNPIHIGHLVIANFMATHTDLDEVWLVVSPQNPLKKAGDLLPDHHRLQMTRLAIKDNDKLKVSDIEFGLPLPSYTYLTLRQLKLDYPDTEFQLIMGEDNLRILDQWRNYEEILANYAIKVYPRISEKEESGEEPLGKFKGDIELCQAPMMKISSTFIRLSIRNHKDVRYLMPDAVINYISNNYLYEEKLD
jgi:nicotinate-nucleotide adenylyltransferase